MSKLNRAAQFSPFAALTGYDEIIDEYARETLPFSEPGCDSAAETERILNDLIFGGLDAECTVTYFVPDARKNGGEYRTARGKIIRYDETTGDLTLSGGEIINIALIKSVRIEEQQ